MKDRVNTDGGRETKGERHWRRLGNNGEQADLLLSELASGAVRAYVVGMYKHMVSDPERRRYYAILIHIFLHGVLCVLHTIAKEFMHFIEVHSEMLGMQVSNLDIWVNGNQRVISAGREERGYARGGMRSIVVSKLS